jgi:hypothetical protein
VVLVTDGYVGVEAQAFKFVREHLTTRTSSPSIGLGEPELISLARAGLGTPFVVLSPEKAEAGRRFRAVHRVAGATGVKLSFSGVAAHEVARRVPTSWQAGDRLRKYRGERGQIGSPEPPEWRLPPDGRARRRWRGRRAPLRWLWARKWWRSRGRAGAGALARTERPSPTWASPTAF